MKKILRFWQSDPTFLSNVSAIQVNPASDGHFVPFPDNFDKDLLNALKQDGIDALYSHQSEAIQAIIQSKHTIITTGTASGKSLCYLLPILERCHKNETATALLLFPTKALTQDQFKNFLRLSPSSLKSSI
ncbi:MAG: DEAD/DEAH box helicase, partial [Bellilinea sp.]